MGQIELRHLGSGWLLDPEFAQAALGMTPPPPTEYPIGQLTDRGAHVPGLSGDVPTLAIDLAGVDPDTLAYLDAALGGPVETPAGLVHGVAAGDGREPWDWNALKPELQAAIRAAGAEFFGQAHRQPTKDARHVFGSALARAWSRHLPRRWAQPLVAAPALDALQVQFRTSSHYAYAHMETMAVQVPQYDGTLSPPLPRELYHAGDVALVLPYDPRTERVLLIEQFRFGAWGQGDPSPWKLEPIAGMVDPGEDPATCARREAVEEAHVELDELLPLPNGYPSPGYTVSYFHSFVGLCDLSEHKAGIAGLASESENIRSHILTLDQALDMMDAGDIDVLPLVTMLLWLSRYRDRARNGG